MTAGPHMAVGAGPAASPSSAFAARAARDQGGQWRRGTGSRRRSPADGAARLGRSQHRAGRGAGARRRAAQGGARRPAAAQGRARGGGRVPAWPGPAGGGGGRLELREGTAALGRASMARGGAQGEPAACAQRRRRVPRRRGGQRRRRSVDSVGEKVEKLEQAVGKLTGDRFWAEDGRKVVVDERGEARGGA